MNSIPLNFTINKFRISIGYIKDGSNYKEATIYGNGRHQIPVKVEIELDDNLPHNIDIKKFKESIYLCYYGNGEELPTKLTDKSMFYGRNMNAYCNLFNPKSGATLASAEFSASNANQELANNKIELELYVSAKEEEDKAGLKIACGIKTDKGNLTTAQDSTNVNMSNGSPWTIPDFVTLSTQKAIDYSRPEHLALDSRNSMWTNTQNFKMIQDDLETISAAPWCTPDSHGVSSIIEDYIVSRYQYKFTTKDVIRTFPPGTLKEVEIAGDGTADMIYWRTGGSINTSFVFIERVEYGVYQGYIVYYWGSCQFIYHITGEGTHSRPKQDHFWERKLEDGKIRISMLNFYLNKSDLSADGWDASPNPLSLKVYVIDEYGNEGTMTIEARSDDWPALRINGAILGANPALS